jgi:hypothetical protein
MSSQILSNFKLFSQNAGNILSKNQPVTSETTLHPFSFKSPTLWAEMNETSAADFASSMRNGVKYKLTLGFLIGVVIVLVYFKREELSRVFAGWVSVAGLNEFVGNLWLNTHLTSAGELASTYVPKDFSDILGATVEIPSE